MLIFEAEQNGIIACTISRDLGRFELIIDDMEATLGDHWGDFTFIDALDVLNRPEFGALEFIVFAIDEGDYAQFNNISDIITKAQENGIEVIFVATALDTAMLDQLTHLGVSHYVSYPITQDALRKTILRIREQRQAKAPPLKKTPDQAAAAQMDQSEDEDGGIVIPIHGMAGGVGSTALAIALAHELSTIMGHDSPRICLIDLDAQFGNIAHQLNIEPNKYVGELLIGADVADPSEFEAALIAYNEHLSVLTAPREMLLFEHITPESITALIKMAAKRFDYVLIDMPKTLTLWSEAVMDESHIYFGVTELDARCVQNIRRMQHELKAEAQSDDKIHYILNRAPKPSDFSGYKRASEIERILNVTFDVRLPDGGFEVEQAQINRSRLMDTSPQNAYRKELQNLASVIHGMSKPQTE